MGSDSAVTAARAARRTLPRSFGRCGSSQVRNGAGSTPLERCRVAEMCRKPLIGLLADRARVEHQDVGVVLALRLTEPEILEEPFDALGVVSVHLTAERGHEVAAHRTSLRSSTLWTERHRIGTKASHPRQRFVVTMKVGGGLGCPERDVRRRHGLAGELDGA